jgi:acetoin utilization deacetylase AcuC-like enzyme
VLFNAGADPHINDPLGGALTTDEMRSRDFIFFLPMKEFGIPVVTSLAGGYQRDKSAGIRPVLELHDNTLIECHRVEREYSSTAERSLTQ